MLLRDSNLVAWVHWLVAGLGHHDRIFTMLPVVMWRRLSDLCAVGGFGDFHFTPAGLRAGRRLVGPGGRLTVSRALQGSLRAWSRVQSQTEPERSALLWGIQHAWQRPQAAILRIPSEFALRAPCSPVSPSTIEPWSKIWC